MAKKRITSQSIGYMRYLVLDLSHFPIIYGKSERKSVKNHKHLLEIADNSGVDNVVIINEKSAEFHLNKEGLELVKSENAELKKN